MIFIGFSDWSRWWAVPAQFKIIMQPELIGLQKPSTYEPINYRAFAVCRQKAPCSSHGGSIFFCSNHNALESLWQDFWANHDGHVSPNWQIYENPPPMNQPVTSLLHSTDKRDHLVHMVAWYFSVLITMHSSLPSRTLEPTKMVMLAWTNKPRKFLRLWTNQLPRSRTLLAKGTV